MFACLLVYLPPTLCPAASAFQSFMLGAGHPTTVSHWTRSFPFPTRLTSQSVLNTGGRKVWRADGPTEGKCIWQMHGVWAWDTQKDEGVVLRESYFSKNPTTGLKVTILLSFPAEWLLIDRIQIDWYTDFYYPFLTTWKERIHKVSPADKMVFVEPIPNEVRRSSLFLWALTLCLDSSALLRGLQRTSYRTWFMRLIGTI